MEIKQKEFFESRIYVGSKRGYKGESFTESQLTRIIQDFQTYWNKKNDWTIALRISKTNFICMDYSEVGWEIAAIQYPRFPKEVSEIEYFMDSLAEFLLIEFGQNRISIISDYSNGQIKLFEKENAEQTHK